jgi:hypothetical protein
LQIPTIDDVSEPLQVGVEHDHVSPKELEANPKGAREHVPRPSHVEHEDMHEVEDDSHGHLDSNIPPIVTTVNSDGSMEDLDVVDASA